ncbi:hypothetical protein H0H87_008934 [Tephrocybe sp. NHM501043]|nr:hypothetical protein H0H87_008934 [Tephrocybe sp. NHM501043]
MHHSSQPFLIEVTFNLTLVDESAGVIDNTWKLILSAAKTTEEIANAKSEAIPAPSSAKFSRLPVTRHRRVLQMASTNYDAGALLQQRYSSPGIPMVDIISIRGRTLQRTKPNLSRCNSRTAASQAKTSDKGPPRMSRDSSLLRVPPFPLPHRPLPRPVSESSARKKVAKGFNSKCRKPIPPPLVL